MQLRMIARRAAGSFTILGDVAQATGPVPYRRWDELLPYLPGGERAERRGAPPRLPRAARDHGARAPAARAHRARTSSRRSPIAPAPSRRASSRATRRSTRAFEEAARLGGEEGLLAVIAPAVAARRRGRGPGRCSTTRAIPVLTPREAKGMEFDHVIVVEPRADRRGGGRRPGPAGALRRAHAADDDARRRPRAPLAGARSERGRGASAAPGSPAYASSRRRSTYGRIPPWRRYSRSRGVSSRTRRAELLAVRAHRHLARLAVLDARDRVLLAARQAERLRGSRPAGTGAGGCPSSAGSSGGSARSSRRSPRARRGASAPSPPSRATSPSRTPCPRAR